MKKKCCILLALLTACTLLGPASAENIVILESGLPELLYYKCTLPDGRLLLGGLGSVDGKAQPSALLRCLSPDRTVCWEWNDSGYYKAGYATVIQDGTIAVVLDSLSDVRIIRFFTQDGKPTGKEWPVPDDYSEMWGVTPSFIMMIRKDSASFEADLLDWDGNVITGYDGSGMPCCLVQDAGELTLWGQADNYHVAMIRMDSHTGRMLWKTDVGFQVPGMDRAWQMDAVRTEDGGYAGWMEESCSFSNEKKQHVLVKLDPEGNVKWGRWEEFEQETVCAIKPYQDRIVVFCVPEGTDRSHMDTPKIFHWFDEDGTNLGTTRLELTLDDFPFVRGCLENRPEAIPLLTLKMPMFAMPDGLWALAECSAGNSEGGYFTGEAELVMIRIPEL